MFITLISFEPHLFILGWLKLNLNHRTVRLNWGDEYWW